MHHIRKAFTLIELLVVMGVILLLLGIILPVVNRSIEQARIAKCEANQHQVFTALKAFSVDNAECCPGSCGTVPVGGPGTTPYYGVGQLISCTDSLPQSILEQTAQSVLILRHYVPTSAIFHCPQQDSASGIELGTGGRGATFHYVFNQYFVGDMPCAPGGLSSTVSFSPLYSSLFPNDVNHQVTLNRASQITTRCVLITEDGLPNADGNIQDSTKEYDTLSTPLIPYIHATPWHAVRQHKTGDGAGIIADAAVCTYVDGHTEMVYTKIMDGSSPPNYVVQSDITGLPR